MPVGGVRTFLWTSQSAWSLHDLTAHSVDVDHHLTQYPLVVRSDHPDSKHAIDYFLRTGALVRVLPGVHRWADVEETFGLRAEAALRWQANAVLLGSTAARLSWWPDVTDDTVRVSCTTLPPRRRWLDASRQRVPELLIVTAGDVRMASPELSILQMSAGGDARAICQGLRERVVTLDGLRSALAQLPRTARGKTMMRTLLDEARDEPWSTLEIDAHRALREAGITGWRTNVEVIIEGTSYFADVLFHRERVIVELDGRQYHSHAELDDDNRRRNALERAGWRVFNFSGATLGELLPTMVPVLREARSSWKRNRLPLLPLGEDMRQACGDGGWPTA